MKRDLLEEAVADAKLLKETAFENAKNVLVEAMTPKIKEFVESQLGECGPGMMGAQLTGADEALNMYEKHDDEAEDMDMLKKLGIFGQDTGAKVEVKDELENQQDQESEEEDEEETEDEEESDEDEDVEENKMKDDSMNMGVHEEKEEKESDEESVDEVVEITNEDLRTALSEALGALKVEATVTKSFGKGETADAGGLLDKKSGTKPWNEEEPPAAKDLTVKEAKKYLVAYATKNEQLKQENNKLKEAYMTMKQSLQEVTLLNTKLLYTQKLLSIAELNNKQRKGIIEAVDAANTVREVEFVYKSLNESFKLAGVLVSETRTGSAKPSRTSTPSSTVLKESMTRGNSEEGGKNDDMLRIQKLAGILG